MTSRFTDQDRERILAEARGHIRGICGNDGVSATLPPSDELPPADDVLERWERLKPPPEPPQRERGLDTAPIDWEARISEAIATEREFVLAVMGEALGETCAAQRKEIDIELREMRIEIAELRITNAELRHRMNAERGKFGDAPIDCLTP
jgi:hypothetical protein